MERHVNSTIAIPTTPVVVSIERGNNNGRRESITLINTGIEAATIAIDSEARLNNGIVIYPGGVWSDSRDGGYWPTQRQITAISLAGDAELAIQERVVD